MEDNQTIRLLLTLTQNHSTSTAANLSLCSLNSVATSTKGVTSGVVQRFTIFLNTRHTESEFELISFRYNRNAARKIITTAIGEQH
jgi:hypothetical protein